MHHLVVNTASPRNFYKRSKHLVRTPIRRKFTLTPVAQSLFDVGNAYKQSLPTMDFFTTTGRGYYSIIAGHSMRRCYLDREAPSHDSSGWSQIWRNNNAFSTSFDSGYVFYNGNYSPAAGMMGGSSFMRAAAYRFNIPSEITQNISSGYNWKISSLKTTLKNHGIVLTSGNAAVSKTQPTRYPVFAQDAAYTILPSSSNWRLGDLYQLGVFNVQGLNNQPIWTLNNNSQDEIYISATRTDACDNRGATNAFPLWITWPSGSVTYNDGHIINAPNPQIVTHETSDNFKTAAAALISGGYFFITITHKVGDSGGDGYTSTDADYPAYYFTSSSGVTDWWLCTRVQIASIEIVFELE